MLLLLAVFGLVTPLHELLCASINANAVTDANRMRTMELARMREFIFSGLRKDDDMVFDEELKIAVDKNYGYIGFDLNLAISRKRTQNTGSRPNW